MGRVSSIGRLVLLGVLATSSLTCAAVSTEATEPPAQGCADVIAVDVELDPAGMYTFAVTVASVETGWDKYADQWEVRAGDEVLGVRVLTHPHETEQPFTRSQAGIEIAESVNTVTVIARDSVLGYCGATMTVDVPK